MKSALETEQRSECPFSPQVVSRRPAGRVPGKGLGPRAAAKPKEQKSARPAFERLYEQGAEYRRIAEERKQVQSYSPSGIPK